MADSGGIVIEQSMEDRIRQLCIETDRAFVLELLDTCAPLFAKHLASIQEAGSMRDATKLHYASHALKGASLNIGANKLASVCRRIEDSSEMNDFETVDSLMSDLQKEIQGASQALHSVRDRLSHQKP